MRQFFAGLIDYAGSMASGAVAGAAIGSAVPGLGTIAGFIVGAIAGGVCCRVAREVGYSPFGLAGKNNGSGLESAKDLGTKTLTVAATGAAGAGIGAAIGAAIGTFIFPGLGTAFGAIAGAALGAAAGALTGGLINNLSSFFGWDKRQKNEPIRNSPPEGPRGENTVRPEHSSSMRNNQRPSVTPQTPTSQNQQTTGIQSRINGDMAYSNQATAHNRGLRQTPNSSPSARTTHNPN